MPLQHEELRSLRKSRGITQAAMAKAMDVNPVQIHRLETGQRRITVDALEQYCGVLGIHLSDLFRQDAIVPIIGVISAASQVLPLPPNTPHETIAPNLAPDTDRLAAVRWEPEGQISVMHDHLMFFYRDVEGIPDDAWGERCFIRRRDGTARIGWPTLRDGQVHIEDTTIKTEFNVDIKSASPALAVVSPYLLRQLHKSTP